MEQKSHGAAIAAAAAQQQAAALKAAEMEAALASLAAEKAEAEAAERLTQRSQRCLSGLTSWALPDGEVRTLKQQLSAKDSQLDHARRSPRPVELRDGFDRDKARELAYVHVGCEFTLPPREGEISPCAARTAFVDTGDDWADDDLATPRTDEGLLDGRKIYADA